MLTTILSKILLPGVWVRRLFYSSECRRGDAGGRVGLEGKEGGANDRCKLN